MAARPSSPERRCEVLLPNGWRCGRKGTVRDRTGRLARLEAVEVVSVDGMLLRVRFDSANQAQEKGD